MKKALIFALLLCLGFTACGRGSGKAAAPETTPVSTDAPTETEPALGTEPVPETSERLPGVADEATEPDRAWMPGWSIDYVGESGASYRIDDGEAAAYADGLAAAGFQRRDYERGYLLWNEQVILKLFGEQSYETEEWSYQGDQDRWTLSWQMASSGAAPIDLETLQAMLPEDTLLCAIDQTPAGMYEATGLRLLGCAFTDVPSLLPGVRILTPGEHCFTCQLLVGPSGCAAPQSYYGQSPQDALWADADGDGDFEFLYWTYGPTSGLFTLALWAYGLEQGLPVLNAQTILNLSWSDEIRLELEDGLPVFCITPYHYDLDTRESVADEPLRIPLRVENGGFRAASGDLPEQIQFWGSSLFTLTGASVSVLRGLWGNNLVFESSHCLISHTTNPFTGVKIEHIWAAVTADGVRVSGYVSFSGEGELQTAIGLSPVKAPEDLSELAELSPDEVLEALGPAHFDDGDGSVHLWGWITQEAKLLRVAAGTRVLQVSLLDPVTNTEQKAGPLADSSWSDAKDPDTVTVFELIPSEMLNAERWETFLAATAAGQPDAVTLRLFYDTAGFTLELRYDGERYTLLDEGREESFGYLIVSPEDKAWSKARYSSAVHYLLSDDPDMTYKRYFSHVVSSVWDPDFPPTRTVFTLYQD